MVLLLACMGPPTDSPAESDSGMEVWEPHPGGEVRLENPEGEILIGDFYPAVEVGRPSVLLYGDSTKHRREVSELLIQDLIDREWNVLVMDVRGGGDNSDLSVQGGPYDIETGIQFLHGQGAQTPAVVAGMNNCHFGMYQAYKAHTLQDRTQIPAYAMLPFDSYGVCDALLPEFLPAVPAFWIVTNSHPAEAYRAANRPEWWFIDTGLWTGYDDIENELVKGSQVREELLLFLEQALEPETD